LGRAPVVRVLAAGEAASHVGCDLVACWPGRVEDWLAALASPGPRPESWGPALDALAAGVLWLDRSGRVEMANLASARLLGAASPAALRGRRIDDLTRAWEPVPAAPPGNDPGRRGWEWERDGARYRLTLHPIPGPAAGFAALLVDDTEPPGLRRSSAEAEAARPAGEAKIARLDKEARLLQRFSAEVSDRSTAPRAEPAEPLRQADADLFCELVGAYGGLLDLALEQRAYRVDHRAEITERLRELAGRIGGRGGTPRDLVEVHGLSIRRRSGDRPGSVAHAVSEEGGLLILELMGHLASYYRRLAGGATADSGREASA
jgi:PAS domain-containing protein